MNSSVVLDLLIESGLTISFAESMTGGYASYQLIKSPGASSAIKLSLITYSNESKEQMLGITKEELKKHSVVSTEIALLMAKAVKTLANSDIGVGVTGNAGPTVQEDTEDSVACIGIVYNEVEYSYKFQFFNLSRVEAIRKCVDFIYDRLEEILT